MLCGECLPYREQFLVWFVFGLRVKSLKFTLSGTSRRLFILGYISKGNEGGMMAKGNGDDVYLGWLLKDEDREYGDNWRHVV